MMGQPCVLLSGVCAKFHLSVAASIQMNKGVEENQANAAAALWTACLYPVWRELKVKDINNGNIMILYYTNSMWDTMFHCQSRDAEKSENISANSKTTRREIKTKGIFTYHCWHNWHACHVSVAACGLQGLVDGLTNAYWCFQRKMQTCSC